MIRTVVTTTTSPFGDAVYTSFERKVHYSQGMYWIFWSSKSGDSNLWVSFSSDNGHTWTTSPGPFTAFSFGPYGNSYAIEVVGNVVYEINQQFASGTNLLYRRSTLNSDGTFSNGSFTNFYNTSGDVYEPMVTVDSNGFVWVGAISDTCGGFCFPQTGKVWKSNTSDPTIFTDDTGFPYSFSINNTNPHYCNPVGCGLPGTNGKVYFMAINDTAGLTGKLWDGSAWSSPETISTSTVGVLSYLSAPDVSGATDVHAVYTTTDNGTRLVYNKRTSGVWGTEILIDDATGLFGDPTFIKYGDGIRIYWRNTTTNGIYSADVIDGVLATAPTLIQDESATGFVSGNAGLSCLSNLGLGQGAPLPMLVYSVNGSAFSLISLTDTNPAPTRGATTISTITGKPHIQDVRLLSGPYANFNDGGGTSLDAGNDNTDSITISTLIRLDKSVIPAGTITGFRLNLYRAAIAQSTGAGTVKVFRVKNNPNWIEGTASFTTQNGSVCWNYLAYDPSTPTPWAGGTNGATISGTDYIADSSPPSFSYLAYTSGPDLLITLDLPASWASDWRDGVLDNQGIVLYTALAPNDVIGFRSTENSTNKPSFNIFYIPPPTPPTSSTWFSGGSGSRWFGGGF